MQEPRQLLVTAFTRNFDFGACIRNMALVM